MIYLWWDQMGTCNKRAVLIPQQHFRTLPWQKESSVVQETRKQGDGAPTHKWKSEVGNQKPEQPRLEPPRKGKQYTTSWTSCLWSRFPPSQPFSKNSNFQYLTFHLGQNAVTLQKMKKKMGGRPGRETSRIKIQTTPEEKTQTIYLRSPQ